MLCGSHLHDCAHRNPVHTMVFIDIIAMLIRNYFAHEYVPASQLATHNSITVPVLACPGSPVVDVDVCA